METNKLQWKRIAKGEKLPCDSLLMKKDGTIITVATCAGVVVGQDAYYLPVEELRTLPKDDSEDERIRKGIIRNLEYLADRAEGFVKDELKERIAWLEKQGEHAKFRDFIQVGDKVTRNEDGVLVNLSQLKRVAKKDEKQGEHKPLGFNIGDDITVNGQICKVVAVEQKPTDKVEPKFKVGDFIVNNYCMGRIVEITNDAYLLDTEQGIPFSSHSTRLWDITKDAKDGDVLINWNNTAFIFKSIEDETVKFHIAYNEKWDAIKTPSTKLSHLGLPEPQFEFHPATKEQRDTLMKAMTDAGYTFDFEKKELKKIGQKPADLKTKAGNWYICDMEVINENMVTAFHRDEIYYCPKDGYLDVGGALFEVGCLDVFRLATEKEIPQPKQEWSEEDEKLFGLLNTCVCRCITDPYWDYEKRENVSRNIPTFLDKLKTFIHQSHWKPSDEQMNAFDAVLVYNPPCSSECRNHLITLYNDLKKLREI